MKHKLINGYTKESLKRVFRKYNKGKPAIYQHIAAEDCDSHYKGEILNEFCTYHSPIDGNRCVIGCCLPDEFIDKHAIEISIFEKSVEDLLVEYPELEDAMPFDKRGCCDFQLVHDISTNIGEDFYKEIETWIDNNTYV